MNYETADATTVASVVPEARQTESYGEAAMEKRKKEVSEEGEREERKKE